jgi:hypothetical protein
MLSETEQLLTDMEHTSTSKFVNVHEQIVRVQQYVLDTQGDVQRDEATFAQINQAYQQVINKFKFKLNILFVVFFFRNFIMQQFVNIFDHFH